MSDRLSGRVVSFCALTILATGSGGCSDCGSGIAYPIPEGGVDDDSGRLDAGDADHPSGDLAHPDGAPPTDGAGGDAVGADTQRADSAATDQPLPADASGTDLSSDAGGGLDTSGGIDSAGSDSAAVDLGGADQANIDAAGADHSGVDTFAPDAGPGDLASADNAGTDSAGADNAGSDSAGIDASAADASSGDLPPDPAAIAPPLSPYEYTSMLDSVSFLYSGARQVQTGVEPDVFDGRRVAVLRGKVLDTSSAPIPGVRVAAPLHPEWGQTLTRADGAFDLVVNGGGQVRLEYTKDGYLPVQRRVETPMADYAAVPDVVLTALDLAVTEVQFGAPVMQVASGSWISDDDGERRASLMFPAGTQAEMRMPGGGTVTLGAASIRATEYTVGPNGPAAMPGELPATSAYTYAVELSADEAIAAGAESVAFDQPAVLYVNDIIGAPVGSPVPVGYYDRTLSAWVGSPSGLAVEVLGVDAGLAQLDVDGSGSVADATTLADLGISDDERTELAILQEASAGTRWWRVPITHMTPTDCNFPWGPPLDAVTPPRPKPSPKPPSDPECKPGSVIECEAMNLGEDVPIAGTAMALHYRSSRLRAALSNRVEIPLSGASIPASLKDIGLSVMIGGREHIQHFEPAPNLSTTFVWEGGDPYNRWLNSSDARITLGYVYPFEYKVGAPWREAWGLASELAASGGGAGFSFSRWEVAKGITFQRRWTEHLEMGIPIAAPGQLGGWSFGIHHSYDPKGQIVALGSGGRMIAQELPSSLRTIAGSGDQCYTEEACGEGEPALGVDMYPAYYIDARPDGSILYFDYAWNCRVRVIHGDGTVSTVAGNGQCFDYTGLGGPAIEADFIRVNFVSLETGPDGEIYLMHDPFTWRIDPDGIMREFGGGGSSVEDFVPALESRWNPTDLAAGSDGSVYIADAGGDWMPAYPRIRRVMPNGVVTPFAGSQASRPPGNIPLEGDGAPATQARINRPNAVAVDKRDNVFFLERYSALRRVGTDGILSTIAGTTVQENTGDGGSASAAHLDCWDFDLDSEGRIYLLCNNSVRVIDTDGQIRRVAHGWFDGMTVTHDDKLLLTGDNHIYALAAPDFGLQIPSSDGTELYVFDESGRHLATRDAVFGTVRRSFSYDASGRLTGIADGDGNTTRIERDGSGRPNSIVAPGGQRTSLTLDSNGYLKTIADPAGATHVFTYTAEGLLTRAEFPSGLVSTMTYDAQGRLLSEEGSDGQSWTLTPEASESGGTVTLRSAEGRSTVYTYERGVDGSQTRTRTEPDETLTTRIVQVDGTEVVTHPDGTIDNLTYAPDPRWGMVAPYLARLHRVNPLGQASDWTNERSVELLDRADLFSLITLSDVMTERGQTSTHVIDVASRTVTSTSAAGRVAVAAYDAKGRIVSAQEDASLDPTDFDFDAQGRLTRVAQGTSALNYTHDSNNDVSEVSDDQGHTATFTYDGRGALLTAEAFGGGTTTYGRDAAGRLTSVTTPGGAQHHLGYDSRDRLATYTPPGSTAHTVTRDLDGNESGRTLPGGAQVQRVVDAYGRFTGHVTDDSETEIAFDAQGRVASDTWTAAADSRSATESVTYDGERVLQRDLSGVHQGSFTYAYSAAGDLQSIVFSRAPFTDTQTLTRDADALVLSRGPLSFTRTGPRGMVSQVQGTALKLDVSFDGAGRPVAHDLSVAGTERYTDNLQIDSSDRIVQRIETIAGTPTTWTYAYDLDGQLLEVVRDGAVVETYGYDADGNRITATHQGASDETVTYDGQGRVASCGGVAYGFDAAGSLASRGGDTFVFDARGALLEASLQGGETIVYSYDAVGRRVARTDAAGTTEYFYGDPTDALRLTHVSDAAGAISTLHYDGQGFLVRLDRGGQTYLVATDPVGSPIYVYNSSGTVVRGIERDAFGRVLTDSNPAFEIFVGFAGGLDDPDTGLVRFGLRDYDPFCGRFTARDPIWLESGVTNLYAYVGNDPINGRDPVGLYSIGFGAYAGWGGAVSFHWTKDGMAFCAEAGGGMGAQLSLNVASATPLPQTGYTANMKTSAKLGPFARAELKISQTKPRDCKPGKVNVQPALKLGVPLGPNMGMVGANTNGDISVGAIAYSALGACARF